MKPVNCTEFGDRVLELARGELHDDAAFLAEEHLESCAHCSDWWRASFSSESFEKIDAVVAQTFEDLSLPKRGRDFGWAAVAAAVVMMIGGISWINMPDSRSQTVPFVEQGIVALDFEKAQPTSKIQTISFEETEGVADFHKIPVDVANVDETGEVLFKDGTEDGDFGSWTLHT